MLEREFLKALDWRLRVREIDLECVLLSHFSTSARGISCKITTLIWYAPSVRARTPYPTCLRTAAWGPLPTKRATATTSRWLRDHPPRTSTALSQGSLCLGDRPPSWTPAQSPRKHVGRPSSRTWPLRSYATRTMRPTRTDDKQAYQRPSRCNIRPGSPPVEVHETMARSASSASLYAENLRSLNVIVTDVVSDEGAFGKASYLSASDASCGLLASCGHLHDIAALDVSHAHGVCAEGLVLALLTQPGSYPGRRGVIRAPSLLIRRQRRAHMTLVSSQRCHEKPMSSSRATCS